MTPRAATEAGSFPVASCMQQLFEERFERSPDAVALVSNEGWLSYRELEERANQVAHALQALGVGPEDRVGLCTGRGLEMLVGLLGILKAGGAYVPLDPAYPHQRLAFILKDARPLVILTRSVVEPALPESAARLLRLDSDPDLRARPIHRPPCAAGPDNVAYVLFTSGSTGQPKGVLIEHRGVVQLSAALVESFGLTPGGRVLQFSSLNFDLSVSEMLMAWAIGGSLHLVPQGALVPGPLLHGLLREQSITHAVLPPSLLAVLDTEGLERLEVLVSTGEACTPTVVRRWARGRRLFNAYGPTETTVYATVHACLPDSTYGERPPSIGRPLAGTRVHVLDAGLRPVTAGEAGELFIGGMGVGRGYLGRPELTSQRFVPHPETGERLYRTGDLTRFLPDGALEYLGRMDDQLKIRGHRVEPGEIEAVLARHGAVLAVKVVGREDVPGEVRLVAYLVVREGQSPGPSGWRYFARELLPEALVPAAFVELPAMPLSPNGKVDRRALPPPGRQRPALDTAFRPPCSPVERGLEAIWSQVLGVEPVGLDDDFLELGGDSLRATAAAMRVREALGVDVSPFEVLQARTLARLAGRVEGPRERASAPALVRQVRPGALPLSFAQRRLWFLHRLEPTSAAYNMAVGLRLRGPLDAAVLVHALGALVARHEALRTSFPLEQDGPVQHIHPPAPFPLPVLELAHLDEADPAARLAAYAREQLTRPFDLSTGPLLRGHLVSLGATEHVLLLALHHSVCDGESLPVLAREVAALYEGALAHDAAPLPGLAVQYADYTLWQARWLEGGALETGLAFWKRELAGASRNLALPVDHSRPSTPTGRGARQPLRIPASTVRALEVLARSEGATLFMALLAALGALLERCTGSADVLVGVPVAGRDQRVLEGLIGFFVNTLALRVRLGGEPSFHELLARVRERTLAAYEHQAVPFEKVVEAVRPEREAGHQPLFRVMLALQRPPTEVVTRAGLRVRAEELDLGLAPFDLTWNLRERDGGLEGELLYSADLFEPRTAERLARDFEALVEEVAAAPQRRLSGLKRASRWLPVVASPARLEEALLADPAVEDCAVRWRRTPDGRVLRVAYVVRSAARPAGPTGALGLAPDVVVPVQALPLDPAGHIDEDALERLELLDEDVVQRCEAQLRASSDGTEVVVAVRPVMPSATFVHLSDALPGIRVEEPSRGDVLAEAPARTAPAGARGPVRMALSDGGPLVIPEDSPRTLTAALVRSAGSPIARGTLYVGQEGSRQRQDYRELLHEARCLLAGLRAWGMRPGERLILQLDSPREHCTALWACLLGGFVPVAVAVAPSYETRNAVVDKLHGAWELLGRPPLLTSSWLRARLAGLGTLLPMSEVRLIAVEELARHAPAEHLHPARPEDVVFLQLSSGSTGRPKCIQVTHSGIIHQVHGSARDNPFAPEDVTLNWLPFDHVGPVLLYHLSCVYRGHSQIHVSTEWILADPLRWLDLMEAEGVTHTWSPNFGYKLLTDALERHPERTWKLHGLKRLLTGGEQVTPSVVREFLARVAPFGIQPSMLQPAFGMAESCTVVAYQNRFHQGGVHHVAKSSLGGTLEFKATADASTVTFMELGPPTSGVQLRIVDADNQLLPEGVIGRFQIRGPVVTPGYLHNEEANRAAFVGDGWFNTGDSGFLLDGCLTLTGREKEMIIVRGSHLYCHELEDKVCGVDGVELAAATGVETSLVGTEEFAIFFVPREAGFEKSARLVSQIKARVTASFGASPRYVLPLSASEFPRTTSGKIQREALKKALAAGRFDSTLKALDLHERNAHTLPSWFHRRSWRPKEAVVRTAPHEGPCLVFLDEAGLGERVREALLAAGRRCVGVVAGEETAQLVPDSFRLRPDDAQGYRWMLARLAEEGALPSQVLHLWTFEADAPGFPEELQRRGAFGVLLLLQALAQTGEGRGLRLQVVSSRSQAMRPGEPLDCEKALLLGLLQTAPQELPWLDARHLDLEPGAAPEENATRVLRELTVGPREREVAYREGRRLVPRLERVELTAAAQRPLPLVTGGMYLVTGGLGALGAELARRLLSHHRARLLLLGRTELSGTGGVERRRTLEELAAFATRVGGEVRYAALDVCDLEGLREGVRRAEADWGRTLDGAFHLAGAIEERLLSDESPEHFAEVLRPKVEGTRALARLLDERPGAFLIGFSSVNATFGGFSAGAYSAANRFLEHFLQARREAGASRDVCLAWSRWDGLGPARSETAARLASARGYQPIPPSRGWTSLLVGLCSTEGQLLIGLDEHNPYLRAQVEGMAPRARQLTAFLTPERVHARPPSQLRDSLGTPVACELRQVDRLPRTAGGVVDMDALLAVDAGGAGAERAREAPSGEVEARVAAVWREYLGVEEVGMLDNFFELGGHSMLIAQVHSRLERDFGRRFPVLELFRYPTVRALAGYLSAVEQPDGGGDEIEERARRQRAVRGRRRSRQVLHSGGGIDE